LADIQTGDAHIIIGTHALFQKDVHFKDLGLVIVDEQHRFGVHQRLELAGKGQKADVLVMTATPIPRTLTMTVYGDMDVSRLDEKPANRLPIDTRLASLDRLHDVVEGIGRKINEGAQVYWVCPLVEESEKLDLKAATARYEELRTIFHDKVALVHGKMKAQEKDEVMARFKNNEFKLLISTTVIEVGVDVPNASIMVIEHAERFGLAQLHQLRGRVGRGSAQSNCILLYAPQTTEIAKKRLQTIRQTEDGFIIAEEDLKLRGAGEVLGTRQSGLPQFHFFDFEAHSDLLAIARDDAKLIMAKDKDLKSERGKALITLIHLFKKEQAMTYLRG
jgi:ATP-dependent DNA helicase RecG